MLNNTSGEVILVLMIAVVAVMAFVKMIDSPISSMGKFFFNSIIGIVMLVFINIFGHFFGLVVPLNIYTILCTATLGIPGLIVVVGLTILL